MKKSNLILVIYSFSLKAGLQEEEIEEYKESSTKKFGAHVRLLIKLFKWLSPNGLKLFAIVGEFYSQDSEYREFC